MVQHVFMAAHSVESMLGDKEEGPQVAGRTPECTHSLGTAWKEGWGGRSGPSYGGGKTSTVQTLNWSRGQAEKGAGRQDIPRTERVFATPRGKSKCLLEAADSRSWSTVTMGT